MSPKTKIHLKQEKTFTLLYLSHILIYILQSMLNTYSHIVERPNSIDATIYVPKPIAVVALFFHFVCVFVNFSSASAMQPHALHSHTQPPHSHTNTICNKIGIPWSNGMQCISAICLLVFFFFFIWFLFSYLLPGQCCRNNRPKTRDAKRRLLFIFWHFLRATKIVCTNSTSK